MTFIIASAFVVMACGKIDGGKKSNRTTSMETASKESGSLSLNIPTTGAPSTAKTLTVVITSQVNPNIRIQITKDFEPGKSVTVSEVPSGAIKVDLILVDHLDQKIAEGSATTVITSGTKNPLNIKLTPVTGTLDIEVEWTSHVGGPVKSTSELVKGWNVDGKELSCLARKLPSDQPIICNTSALILDPRTESFLDKCVANGFKQVGCDPCLPPTWCSASLGVFGK